MLFVLRLAFWIVLICLLLPGSHEDNSRLINSAERTVNDLRGFCQRNPDVCEEARTAMTSLLSKLKKGAELAQTWLVKDEKPGELSEPVPPPQSPEPPEAQNPPVEGNTAAPPRLVPQWQNSLNPADKQLPWRGPERL